jgi:type II secretory pathway pseudopilin PulG
MEEMITTFASRSASPFRRTSSRAFVMLEVMVAIIIIGLAAVALVRGFIVSLDTVSRVRMNEQAILLGRSIMDDMMLEPPSEGEYNGRFADDNRFGEAFAGWEWEMEVETIEPDYDEVPKGNLLQDLEVLYHTKLRINFDNGEEVETYLEMQLFLPDPDFFTDESLQSNQLF